MQCCAKRRLKRLRRWLRRRVVDCDNRDQGGVRAGCGVIRHREAEEQRDAMQHRPVAVKRSADPPGAVRRQDRRAGRETSSGDLGCEPAVKTGFEHAEKTRNITRIMIGALASDWITRLLPASRLARGARVAPRRPRAPQPHRRRGPRALRHARSRGRASASASAIAPSRVASRVRGRGRDGTLARRAAARHRTAAPARHACTAHTAPPAARSAVNLSGSRVSLRE